MSELFSFTHPGFIWTSYALGGLAVAGLMAWVLGERAGVRKRLDREEGRSPR